MWTCKHCKESFEFTLVPEKANHTRWCHKNPNRNNWNKDYGVLSTYGSLKEFLVKCNVCKKSFHVIEREKLHPQKDRYFCSASCGHSVVGKARKVLLHGQDKLNYRTICWMYHEKKCIACGEDKIVVVHHHDMDKNNNSPDNLIPLCPTHHHYYHSKYKELIEPIIQEYLNKFRGEMFQGGEDALQATWDRFDSDSLHARKGNIR